MNASSHPALGGSGRRGAISDPGPIRLTPGSHASPRDGACVVELASLIAGERFSDRPRCVDPVIAAFLRGWNDRATDPNRQRLRPYAELIVGTRASHERTRARREICLEWADGDPGRGPRRALRRALMRIRIAVYCGLPAAIRLDEGGGDYAARVAFSRRDYDGAFELLDAMLATTEAGPERAARGRGGGNGARATGGPVTNGYGESANGRLPPTLDGAARNGSPEANGAPDTEDPLVDVPDIEKVEV